VLSPFMGLLVPPSVADFGIAFPYLGGGIDAIYSDKAWTDRVESDGEVSWSG
jgi:hypothetical protein